MKKPNIPMNHPITTCRHKVDKKKYEDGWDRIWGKTQETMTPNEVAAAERLLKRILADQDDK
jgi:hypothetical protein